MALSDPETIERYYASELEFLRLVAGKFCHIGAFESAEEDLDQAKSRTVEKLGHWLGIKAGSKLVDLGCGTGESAAHLCRTFNCEVVGMDPVPEQIRFATAAIPGDLKERLSYAQGRAESSALPASHFDGVLSIEVFCYVEAIDRALEECKRILKPGSALVFSDIVMQGPRTHHSDFYFDTAKLGRVPDTISQYKARLASLGFTQVEAIDQSAFFALHFHSGVRRMLALQSELVRRFGKEKWEETFLYYQNGTRPGFLREMSWAWFRAVKA
jgi:sarcosine/dimethylglycine N-methyltransferase